MEESEKMNLEEAKRFTVLTSRLFLAIESDGEYTYQDTIRALDAVKRNYEQKGKDLLNNIKIQEVSKFGAELI